MSSLCQSCVGTLHAGIGGEGIASGIVQGDDPGSVRGLFCHSERFLKGIFTPDDVGYGSSFDEKIFVCRIFFCDVGLGVLECFSALEDAYMRDGYSHSRNKTC